MGWKFVAHCTAVFSFRYKKAKQEREESTDTLFTSMTCYAHRARRLEESWFVLAIEFTGIANAMVLSTKILEALPINRNEFIRLVTQTTPNRKCWSICCDYSEWGITRAKQILQAMHELKDCTEDLPKIKSIANDCMHQELVAYSKQQHRVLGLEDYQQGVFYLREPTKTEARSQKQNNHCEERPKV